MKYLTGKFRSIALIIVAILFSTTASSQNIDTTDFEKRVDQEFYPLMIQMGAISGFSKLKSKHLHIKSREYQFNPDWDEDIILDLFDIFAQNLLWSPPKIPKIFEYNSCDIYI